MNLDSSVYRVLSKCIQNFRKKQLRKKINELKPIFNELNDLCKDRFSDDLLKDRKKIIEESFDRITIKIRNKDIIIKTKSFIDIYKKIYVPLNKFDEKLFLSLWIFSAFPDIVIEPNFFNKTTTTTTTKIKENLFNITCYIIIKINELCLNDELIMNKNFFEDFNKHINEYTLYFDLFIKQDKKEKILESIESYVIIKKNIIKIEESTKYNITEKKEIIQMMKINLEKVQKFISSQIKHFDFKNIDKIVSETLNLENLIIINYINTINKKLNHKDYNYILSILIEIQNFIKKMNKIENDVILEEIIDPEYIIQLIKNDLLNKELIINFGLKLSDYITQSGSVRLSEIRREEIEKFKKQNLNINNLLANIIYINLESIYLVYDEILSFQELKNELHILEL
jgi:hypothetical protein